MADCLDSGCLSFFTANHSRHDKQWLQKGSQLTLVCFACCVEIIENKNEPSIRQSRILKELLSLISAGDILNTLAVNDSVVSHLLNCLWELSDSFDENNVSGSIAVVEIIYQLCCSLKSEALVAKVMECLSEKLFSSENIKMVSPQLDLLGKLLQKIPGLTKNVAQHHQKLMAYIVKSIAFPDEGIRSSLFFVLTHLYRDKDCCSAISASTTEGILRECCEVLTSATSKELQINSAALLLSLTRPDNLPKHSLGSNVERVITSLKKAFLSKEDLVKSLAIGCLDNLVLYDEKIADSDLTGFLFEVFKTKSETLLALGFQCVAQMVEKKALYTKGHMLYGFETIVSALMVACANKNSKLVKQGFSVLAKILGNCPPELSLISSSKVLLQCSDVLNRGLYTLDDAVFFQACRCFSSFLERRHFTCDMPYSRLMALIEPLVEKLDKICTSAVEWNHAEDKDLKSSMIDIILEVIKKSLDLAMCGNNDLPTLEALLVSQEENNRKELEDFVNKLLQLCDQVCIPNVVANLKKFYGTTVPEKFFEILNKLLCTCPVESLKEMCEKFASSCFIRIALDIKAYCFGKSPSATLRASVNTFLETMCCRLCLPDLQQRIKSIFNSSVQHVNGKAQELLQVLMQKYSGDEALKETQECILVIFHLAYQHGDRLVTTSQLLHALSNFLVLNPTCFDNPCQAIIPSCLTWLFVTELHHHADRVDDSALLRKAQQILAEGVSKYVNSLEVVYFHDFALVEWVLEMQDLNPALRKGILELYFSHRAESDLTTGKIETWKKMVEKHPATLLFLASILGTGETHAQNAILNVLPHVLNTCPTQSQAFQDITKELKSTFQNLFLNQAVEPLPDQNISSILKLLCLLITSSPNEPLDNDFLKLIYHVVNLLTRPGNSEKLSTECLNFLNASIVHEANSRSDQVLGFLLKHYGFNKFLESVIDSFHSRMDLGSLPEHTTLAAVLVCVSHLLRFQKIFSITTECQLEINLEVVLSLLSYTSSPLLLFTANIIWASILQDDLSNSNVSLTSKTLVGTRNSQQKLSKVHLGMILVRLQNSLLHGNPLVQMSALRCFEALLSSGKDVKSLIQDPWNRVMLREVKDLAGSVTVLVLQLYSLFLYQQRTKGVSLDLPVTDLVQVALERFIEWENPSDLKWLSAYARFFLEVIQSTSHPMSSLQKSNLRCHVEDLMESDPREEADISMKLNHCVFSYVEKVLIHDEIIHGKTNDPVQTLKELLDLLK